MDDEPNFNPSGSWGVEHFDHVLSVACAEWYEAVEANNPECYDWLTRVFQNNPEDYLHPHFYP
jgi:hypothetical protein